MANNTTEKVQVTADTAMFTFYDIESLSNVFTLCTFTPRTNVVEVFYLVDQNNDTLSQQLQDNYDGVNPVTAIDPATAAQIIREKNPAYKGGPGKVRFHDLATQEANELLAMMMGLSDTGDVNNPRETSNYPVTFRPVCDTHPGYDPINQHPYLAGYNSNQYDTVMLALYFMETMQYVYSGSEGNFARSKASDMRYHNDQLFTEAYKKGMFRYLTESPVARGERWNSLPNLIRRDMLASGRHIDVAALNEKQQRVGLKRLCGMLGLQILESDKLSGHNAVVENLGQLHELLAYNVSDVVNLDKLMQHPAYAGGFDLKKGLLDEYPETIYQKKKDSYEPDIRPNRVRRDRLTPDSTSAKFVGLVLSPYGHLNDIETVSFNYPSKQIAEELGIEQTNVLEDTKKFFYDNISDPDARAQFDLVYNYYKSIEGSNFNSSEEYEEYFGPGAMEAKYLPNVQKLPNNIPYFYADGSASSCFATFSTGGIHGAEGNRKKYEAAIDAELSVAADADEIKGFYPDAKDLVAEAKNQYNIITLPNSQDVDLRMITTGATENTIKYRKQAPKDHPEAKELITIAMNLVPDAADLLKLRKIEADTIELPNGKVVEYKQYLAKTSANAAEYKDLSVIKTPELFTLKSDGSTKLHNKYVYTSVGEVIHEDFSSYYPNLLRNLSAFYNPHLGTDRYAKIYDDKERYGKLMKDPTISDAERLRYKVLREGTKLILNTASGAGDANHRTPIRMNNTIISMRILGQLFSYRVAQAQTLAGAKIVSTNTDGLYSMLDMETNNRILEEQAKIINVEIEPEEMLLVSKDSNNRLEVVRTGDQPHETKIISASGSSLSCYDGPTPTQSLAHPAIIDHILAEYMRLMVSGVVPAHRSTPLSIDEEFDVVVGQSIINNAISTMDHPKLARMFQNVIAASAGSITYPFATDLSEESDEQKAGKIGIEELDTQLMPRNPRALQHYSRVFVVKRDTPGAVNLRNAGAYKVTPAMQATRERNNTSSRVVSSVAQKVLETNGLVVSRAQAANGKMTLLPGDEDIVVRKISSIEPDWPMVVVNEDLHEMPQEKLVQLLNSLDYTVYLQMAVEAFNDNWKNDAS